ncbi:O-methyltransferase [Fundidesulfovibrio terrae]|uniref:O-methyltransferase n=1 Tax=Fundidesulfovibrio terrae TaxID=2922866 RepID=UPI001FAFE63F|nr:class I SAM-dependent methyltransferase [Fundidesulfovibrio terrae]
MFHDLSPAMLERMRVLEARDAEDRTDGTPHADRLRQIPPDTGKFLAILAASTPEGDWVEVGSGAGYSAMWLSLACKAKGRGLTTYELSEKKAALARETLRLAGIESQVELVQGDALEELEKRRGVAFAFLDAERSILAPCYELLLTRMVPGGIICADNVISHKHQIEDFLAMIPQDSRVDSVIVPIGSGVLVCRLPG